MIYAGTKSSDYLIKYCEFPLYILYFIFTYRMNNFTNNVTSNNCLCADKKIFGKLSIHKVLNKYSLFDLFIGNITRIEYILIGIVLIWTFFKFMGLKMVSGIKNVPHFFKTLGVGFIKFISFIKK